jgi:hypothetical protein
VVDFQQLTSDLIDRGWSIGRIAQKVEATPGAIRALADGRNKYPRYPTGAALVDLERRTRPRK